MKNKCDICKVPLVDTTSYDVWVSETTYDDDGEPVKTCQETGMERDYLIICQGAGCRQVFNELWSRFATQLTGVQS